MQRQELEVLIVSANIFIEGDAITQKGGSMEQKRMTDCEVMVMKCIWDSPAELTQQQIREIANIRYGKNWKPQTVSTFLQRLVGKGYLQMHRMGRVFFYQPMVDAEKCQMNELQNILTLWYGNSIPLFVDHVEKLVRQAGTDKKLQILGQEEMPEC